MHWVGFPLVKENPFELSHILSMFHAYVLNVCMHEWNMYNMWVYGNTHTTDRIQTLIKLFKEISVKF